MSGYFVHGGTQYAYSQTQQTAAPGQTAAYQQPAQTTQFYQSTAYPGAQATRTALTATNKPAVGAASLYGSTTYGSQTLGQAAAYSTQRVPATTQSYSYDSGTYGRQTSSGSNAFGGSSYGANNATFGTTSGYGAAKAEEKYSSGNTFGGFNKSTPSGGSYSLGLTGNSLNSSSSGNSSYFTQPSQQASFSTSYPSPASYNKPEEASSSQYSYEKALYVAANQYYQNKKNEAANRGGGRGGNNGRGRGRGGRGSFGGGGTTPTGPKIIKATEVKAYLYAWCGQRRLKPEYTIEPNGMPPRMKFVCTLKISGLEYIAKVTAASKKDSQSKAAWDFCEHLVKTGYMKESELPQKPVDPAPRAPKAESESVSTEAPQQMEDNGGWTLDNCRQRLNQFTQRWRIPAEFKHETHGPEHARSFVAELTIKVKWLEKEFTAKERGSNKKQATAVCALAMLRQLFKEGLIEKHGDPIKHPRRSGGEKKEATKRKADEEVSNGSDEIDEYGNWKLDDSRQRLHIFCQTTDQTLDIKYTTDGNTPPKTFTASAAINVSIDNEKKTLEASHTCSGKKVAAQHVAQLLIKQLYALSLVEPNIGIQQSKKKNARSRTHSEMMALMDNPFGPPPMFAPGPMFGPFGPFSPPPPPMQRKTPIDDAIINEKHKRIYPSDFELNMIQKIVRNIETALKKVSDELSEIMVEEDKKPIKQEIKQEPGTENVATDGKRALQGVMRVGALAKGLLLSGDVSAQLVLLSVNVPTKGMLTKIGSSLSRILEEGGDKYLVEIKLHECTIVVTSPTETNEKKEPVRFTVKICLTSPLMRNLEPTTGPADMLDRDNCLRSLAELRHAKWFQACAKGVPSCVMLIRIFKDMRKRNTTWAPLNDWALELIIEKALRTSFGQLTVGEAMRRVLSCISSGILLEDGGGIYDPCEKTPTDVIGSMTAQEREDITESAHHALRMLVYRQTHKILGIEPLPQRVRRSTDGDSTMETS